MFTIDNDMTINVTRGDCGKIDVSATVDDAVYVFSPGDILRLKVFEKKNCENVVLKKDFGIEVNATTVTLTLTGKDTKFGGIINKPTNYWYEIELNPETNPQTIVGYDDDGPKLFCLHPEGKEVEETEPDETEVGAFDDKLDLTSNKALPNKVIAQAIYALQGKVKQNETGNISVSAFGAVGDGKTDDSEAIEQAIASLTDNSTLVFPIGHYIVSHKTEGINPSYEGTEPIIFELRDLKNITIDLCGSVIEMKGMLKDGVIQNSNFKGYKVFDFVDCQNFTIKNGIIVGDRIPHDYSDTSYLHNHGYGVAVRSGVKENWNVANAESCISDTKKCYGKIVNCEIYDMTGDGIMIANGKSPGTVIIENCNIHHCRRQGITIADSDVVKVLNSHIHHIGTFDGITGLSPFSGIDIEPDRGTFNVNAFEINNSRIEHTSRQSITSGMNYNADGTVKVTVKSVVIDNCYLSGSLIFNCPYDRTDSTKKTKIVIKNSTLKHQNVTEDKYERFNIINGEISNCIVESLFDKETTDTSDVFSGSSILNSCILYLSNTTNLRNVSLENCTVNGGIIYNHYNASTVLKDCTNVVFNNCLFYCADTSTENSRYKYLFCTFKNVSLKSGVGAIYQKFYNCYFDSEFLKLANDFKNYVNCIVGGEVKNAD